MSLPLRDVLDEESVSIVPWKEHFPDDSLHSLFAEVQIVCSNEGRVDEVESDGVGSKLVAHVHWVGVILESFGHFLSVLSENEAVDDEVFVGVTVLDSRRNNVEGVEPSSSLVDSLTNEVCGEYFAEFLFVGAERIVHLGEGHRSTLKPTVEHFLDSSQFSFSLSAIDGQMVDVLSV